MRTIELHAHAKQVQRASGRSSVAAAAYRAGALLIDERTGEQHDYTKKQGVEHSRIFVPENAPEWAADRSKLWNGCEAKENRSNSCTARELEVAFPHEFNAMQRREVGRAIAQELMGRYNVAVDIAYHVPTGAADERNFHAHILFTSRSFDETTKDGWAKNKYRDFAKDALKDDHGQIKRDDTGKVITRGSQTITSLREFVAGEMNRIAERDQLNVQVEHLSFEARGIDREPEQHLGPAAAGMEQKKQASRIAAENEAIREENSRRAINHAMALKLQMDIDAKRQRFEDWAAQKVGELESAQQLSMLDLLRGQERDQGDLSEHLAEYYGTHLKTVETELKAVEQRLGAKGFARLWRSMTGKNRADRERLQKLQWTVEDAYLRMQEQRDKLADAQRSERERVEALQAERRHNVDAGIERARQRKEETLRAHQHDAALSPEDAAQHRTGVDATTQAAAVQSLADRARAAQKTQIDQAGNQNHSKADRGWDRGHGPDIER